MCRLSSLCAVTAATTPTNRVTGTWTGPASALSAHLASLIAAVGAAPTSRTTHTYDYLSAMKYFAGCMQRAVELFKKHGMRVIDARMERNEENLEFADVRVQITYFDSKRVNAAERAIEADPELQLMSSQNL